MTSKLRAGESQSNTKSAKFVLFMLWTTTALLSILYSDAQTTGRILNCILDFSLVFD